MPGKPTESEQAEALASAKALAREVIEQYVKRFSSNLVRAAAILDYVPRATTPPTRLEAAQEDLLRATVVFLHSALEDLLRTLGEARLPVAHADALARIPLAGTAPAEKFGLVQLAAFRGQTVEEVIAASVREHLGQVSFNNTTEIAGLMTNLGVSVEPLRKHFPVVEQMIERRHRIVHQADLVSGTLPTPSAITRDEVSSWLIATASFAIDLVADFGVTITLERLVKSFPWLKT